MTPEGWRNRTFGEIADFRNGLNFTRGETGDEVKIIGIPDFGQRGEFRDASTLSAIRVAGRLAKENLLQSDDLLFVRSNGNKELVGRCMRILDVREPISFSGFTIRARVNQRHILPGYAAALMRTEIVRGQFRRRGGGTNISNLSQEILSDLLLPIPPLPEQRKIAEILSTWDRAIETTEALLAAAKAQKRALMQTLLTGKRRFPEFDGQPWPEHPLEDLVRIKSGNTPSKSKPEFWGGDVPWFSAKDLKVHHLSDAIDHLTHDGAVKAAMVPKGAVLILVRGMTLLKDFPVGIATREVAFNQDLKALLPRKGVSALFLSYALAARKAQFMRLVNTANHGTGRLDTSLLLSVPIGLPSAAEQMKIETVVRECDHEIDRLTQEVDGLMAEKKALMQQLLTGKRRVKTND